MQLPWKNISDEYPLWLIRPQKLPAERHGVLQGDRVRPRADILQTQKYPQKSYSLSIRNLDRSDKWEKREEERLIFLCCCWNLLVNLSQTVSENVTTCNSLHLLSLFSFPFFLVFCFFLLSLFHFLSITVSLKTCITWALLKFAANIKMKYK